MIEGDPIFCATRYIFFVGALSQIGDGATSGRFVCDWVTAIPGALRLGGAEFFNSNYFFEQIAINHGHIKKKYLFKILQVRAMGRYVFSDTLFAKGTPFEIISRGRKSF